MSSQKDSASNPEEILMALDQVEQTIEVMASVVDQLKGQLHSEFCYNEQVEEIAQCSIEHNVAPQNIVH